MAILMADGRSRFTAVSRFKDEAITDDRKKYAPTALSLCENASTATRVAVLEVQPVVHCQRSIRRSIR